MSNLLLLFILSILLAAFFGMSILLRIIRSLPMTNVGYNPPMTTTVVRSASNEGGIGGSLALLIIVGGIFWLLFSRSLSSDDATPPATEQQEERYDDGNESTPEEEYHPEEELQTISASSPSSNIPLGRLNVSPSRGDEQSFGEFGIQVSAFKAFESATAIAQALAEVHTVRVFSDANNGYFKVLVIGFESREDATSYKRRHQLDGFVKELANNGLVLMTQDF